MEICRYLVIIYGENVMSVQMISKWCLQFDAGWESIDDIPCTRHPIHTNENRHRVEKLILSDRLVTVTELEAATGLARCQIYQFIYELVF